MKPDRLWRLPILLAVIVLFATQVLAQMAKPLPDWWRHVLLSAAALAVMTLGLQAARAKRSAGLWCAVLGATGLAAHSWWAQSDLTIILLLLLTSIALKHSNDLRERAASSMHPVEDTRGTAACDGELSCQPDPKDSRVQPPVPTSQPRTVNAEHRVQASSKAPEGFPALTGLRVLVADDNTMIRMLLERIIRQAGHSVSGVSNGAQAVDAVEHGHFDIVLIDVSMPVMNGQDAARAMRDTLRNAGKPPVGIIGISGHAMPGDEAASLASGMDLYLTKPIQREVLLKALDFVAARTIAAQSRG